MKRIVVLIDGTWDYEGRGDDTNVAKIDAKQFILAKSAAGTPQICHYHDGVGKEGDLLTRFLGPRVRTH